MDDVSVIQLVLALCVGVALSAACGFRVFAPLLVVSLAVRFGGLPVGEDFVWLGTSLTVVVLLTATLVEIAAYYIPWVDNLLDTVNTPLAVVAGTVVTCGMLPELHSCLKWGIAVVLGGGSAGVVQTATAIVRGGSTATTGGLGNGILSTIENVVAVVVSVLAILVPILAIVIAFIVVFVAIRLTVGLVRRLRGR